MSLPGLMLGGIGNAEGDMVHTAGARPGRGQIGPHGHMQLGGGARVGRAGAGHAEHMHGRVRFLRMREMAQFAHAQHPRQEKGGGFQPGHGHRHRPQAPDLVLGRDGAARPGEDGRGRFGGNEGQPLALEILEQEHGAAIARGRRLMAHAQGGETLLPPGQAGGAVHAQPHLGDAVAAPLLRRCVRPIEKGEIMAGAGDLIGVEKMIRADIVLIDRFLDQAHAQRLGVEVIIAARLRGNRGQVVQTEKYGRHV